MVWEIITRIGKGEEFFLVTKRRVINSKGYNKKTLMFIGIEK